MAHVVSGDRVAKLAPDGTLLGTFSHGNHWAQGVAVDGAGNVWVAHSIIGQNSTVGHLLTDGTYVGNVTLPGGAGPTGVSVDSNGKVWVTNTLDCGITWTTRTGNSPPPPDSVREYMAVIVASAVSQSRASIDGDTPHVVVVRTHPGYSSNPGHAGLGTVVATVC